MARSVKRMAQCTAWSRANGQISAAHRIGPHNRLLLFQMYPSEMWANCNSDAPQTRARRPENDTLHDVKWRIKYNPICHGSYFNLYHHNRLCWALLKLFAARIFARKTRSHQKVSAAALGRGSCVEGKSSAGGFLRWPLAAEGLGLCACS